MASIKLISPQKKPAYYKLTANVCVNGKPERRYSRFDFDPTTLKTRRQREAAAAEAALRFEKNVQEQVDEQAKGGGKTFAEVAREYIDSTRSVLDPSLRLEGDYEQHKNKRNTTLSKEKYLQKICQVSKLGEMPINKMRKADCDAVLKRLGEPDVRSKNGYATLRPEGWKYKTMSCPKIAAFCSVREETVEYVFRGRRTSLKTAEEIANALNCDVEEMFEVQRDRRPLSRKTIKEVANLMRLVMEYAHDQYDVENDTQTLNVRNAKSRRVDCLHRDEVAALLKILPECSETEQIIVMPLLNTGMRRGELAGLTWEDFNFQECTVHVERSLLRFAGAGYHLTTTKEDNIRDIDVAPEYMEYMQRKYEDWKAKRKRMGASWQNCTDGKRQQSVESLSRLRGYNFVVCNDFGFPLNPDNYGKAVTAVKERAGIQRNIHPHMFRHTFVSILLSNPDIGVATVAAEAGHAQPSTTLAIYTQIYHKRQDEIRSQMSQTLYAKKEPER